MKRSSVCVDSSIVIKLVVEEDHSETSRALWKAWVEEGLEIVAPSLLDYEVASVLRKHAARGLRSHEESREALRRAKLLAIQHPHVPDLHLRALEMAHRLDRPTAYDSHYLAMAEFLSCEFHTADERLVNSVRKSLRWVKALGGS